MWFERDLRFDPLLAMGVILLTGIGVFMIYSTSAVSAHRMFHGQSAFFLKKQVMFAMIGLVCMLAAMHFNHQKLRTLSWPILGMSMVLLIAVLVPGIGMKIKGGQRWIRFFGIGIQPSEIARLAVVIFLAHALTARQDLIKSFKQGFLPYILICSAVILLIFREPDMGGAITVGLITLTMLFVAGTRFVYILGTMSLSIPVTLLYLVLDPLRWKRILATINPWLYWKDTGWQLVQSFLAFGSGGISGVGLGEGRQKLFYVPDAHTDFILSVIGEEFGLVGVIFIMLLFAMVAWRGATVAWRASSLFGCFLAFGLTAMIVEPALINMMVVMGLLPTKGLVLPFLSYGGSALVVYMTAAGILLNVSSKMYRTR